jgi:hypothetical protein
LVLWRGQCAQRTALYARAATPWLQYRVSRRAGTLVGSEMQRETGGVQEWIGHSAEQLQTMRDHLERLKQLGIEAIDE